MEKVEEFFPSSDSIKIIQQKHRFFYQIELFFNFFILSGVRAFLQQSSSDTKQK